MKIVKRYILMIFILLSWGIYSTAQEIEYQGSSLWTGIGDANICGNYAYCACLYGLAVVDLVDFEEPRLVGQAFYRDSYEQDANFSREIELLGNYAFMADGERSLVA